MPRIDVSGIEIEYELVGTPGSPAVALTPGGRFSKDSLGIRPLAEAIAAGGKRVLLWDRPNTGASDMIFEGPSESQLQAEVLIELIRRLDLGPTAIGGGSAGARCSLLAAVHSPSDVSHLLQWWITGGTVGLMMLGASYFCEQAVAARAGGMSAVACLPAWSEQLDRNPRNRDYLLSRDPEAFIETMTRWATAFIPDSQSPVPGMTIDDYARLEMPVMIIDGASSDIWHPKEVSTRVHELIPHSKLKAAPWPDEAPMQRIGETAQTGQAPFADWHLLAPTILEFVGTAP